MAENKKVQIKNTGGDSLFPRATLDNIGASTASNTTMIASDGKILNTYLPSATSASAGTVRLATNAEASAGSIASKSVTPAGMKYAHTWTAIQDKGTSAAVTLAPGGVFKVAPSGATVTLSAGTVSAGMYGADARLEMYLGSNTVKAVAPLVLVDPLTPNAGNNCVIKYRGGNAFLYKEGTEAGYIVTNSATSATTSGTLTYGITNSQGWIVVPPGSYSVQLGSGVLKKDTSILCLDSDPSSDTSVQGIFNLTSGGLNFINGNNVSAYVSSGSKPVHLAGSIGYAAIQYATTGGAVWIADRTSIGNGGHIYGSSPFVWGGSQCILNSVGFEKCGVDDSRMFYNPQMTSCTFTSCTADGVGGFVSGGDVRDGLVTGCTNNGPIGLMEDVHISNCVFSKCIVSSDGAIVESCSVDGGQFLNNSATYSSNGNPVNGGTISAAIVRVTPGDVYRDCVISGNSARGAYMICNSGGRFTNCQITDNRGGFMALADKLYDSGTYPYKPIYDRSHVFESCTISGNSTSYGYSMLTAGAAVVFKDCTIAEQIRPVSAGDTVITFQGYNRFTGNISGGGNFDWPYVYIIDGAVVDFSGGGSNTYISSYVSNYGSGSARIFVGSFGSDHKFYPGGTATIIHSSGWSSVISGADTDNGEVYVYSCIDPSGVD